MHRLASDKPTPAQHHNAKPDEQQNPSGDGAQKAQKLPFAAIPGIEAAQMRHQPPMRPAHRLLINAVECFGIAAEHLGLDQNLPRPARIAAQQAVRAAQLPRQIATPRAGALAQQGPHILNQRIETIWLHGGLIPAPRPSGNRSKRGVVKGMLHQISLGDPALPPMIFAHGLHGQARNWGMITRQLQDLRHCISFDLRNHGDSPWFDSHSYADLAADLAQEIEALGAGPVDILGHSMGGKAVMVLALTRPDLVRRLVVADMAPVRYGHNPVDLVRAMQALDLSRFTRRPEAARALSEAAGIEADVAGFLTQNLDLVAGRWKINLEVLAAEMPEIIGFPDFSASFGGLVLFLAGANSPYIRPEHEGEIARLFPAAQILHIPDAGHWLHADQPAQVAQAIRDFLAA